METTIANPHLQFAAYKTIPNQFHTLRTIKYSGSKFRLLQPIVWLVNQILKPASTILDLMAGTHCVGYALKQQYRIYANDIQEYSYVIGKACLEYGGYAINRKLAETDLLNNIRKNSRTSEFDLFQRLYADTYFTSAQCVEIDNIRGAIQGLATPRKELYLTILMSAMCYTGNTTGHFAEYLRGAPLNPRSVQELFFQKCESFSIAPNMYSNVVFNLDYRKFIDAREPELVEIVRASDLIYLDPPYSPAQYSRFYHILETLVKYDYPEVEFKGRYRKDRHLSAFCRKSTAQAELDYALKRCSEINTGFVLLSYVDSDSCLIPRKTFEETVQSHFNYTTRPLTFQVSHSKLGNGCSKKVTEYLILATNLRQGKIMMDKLNDQFLITIKL